MTTKTWIRFKRDDEYSAQFSEGEEGYIDGYVSVKDQPHMVVIVGNKTAIVRVQPDFWGDYEVIQKSV